jgi:glycosyltransferase involved in cell wall biosynthesis
VAAEDRPRVVQLIPALGFGGLERVAVLLTLELHARGVDVLVCTAADGGGQYLAELEAAGVRIARVARPWPRPVPLTRSAIDLARVLVRERPDVIHAHNPGPGAAAGLARLLSLRRRTAVVTTFHGVMPHRLGLAARALRFSSDVIVGCGPTATELLVAAGMPATRTTTVLNGVATDPPAAAEPLRRALGALDRPLVVTVGRHVVEKNHALLIDATAELIRRGLRPRVAIVGGGGMGSPLTPDLERQIARLGLQDDVVLVPERADARDIVAAADVFALSSLSEALPLVVLEAMQLGTPVVSTDAGGVRDAVVDGERGLLVPNGDSLAFADALERLLGDAELRAGLAARARAWATTATTAPAMADGYLDVYRDAIRLRSGARPS